MDPLYIQIIFGALGVAVALAMIIPSMFGTPQEDEYYSELAEWEENWQARNEAGKRRRLFEDSKNG